MSEREEFDKVIFMEATRRGRKLHPTEVDFYWQGLKDLKLIQVVRGILEHSKDPDRCHHMPLAGDIRRHMYVRSAESPPRADVLELTSGQRWDLPRHAYLNPTLPADERLHDADALLAKSDVELEALGIKRAGVEWVRGMLAARGDEDGARRRVRDKLASLSETYVPRPAGEGLMSAGQAQELLKQYGDDKPNKKRRPQGVGV